MEENPGKNKLDAYNELCLNFLLDYNEANFVNEIKSKSNSNWAVRAISIMIFIRKRRFNMFQGGRHA